MSLELLKKDLRNLAEPKKAKVLQRFFKTKPGEYAEGDIFLGVVVPNQRKIAKFYPHLTLKELQELINSKIHEERLISLLILIDKYKKADAKEKELLYRFYIDNLSQINNWDLVDLSAPNILGAHLLNKKKNILYNLANSKNLWEKRISIISCLAFIKKGDFKDALTISKILLRDENDLIHKAVGWMLREIGKRDLKTGEDFLKKYSKIMPRTMLRYAIEKFPKEKRESYLKGEI